jgi:hypothetical protein
VGAASLWARTMMMDLEWCEAQPCSASRWEQADRDKLKDEEVVGKMKHARHQRE